MPPLAQHGIELNTFLPADLPASRGAPADPPDHDAFGRHLQQAAARSAEPAAHASSAGMADSTDASRTRREEKDRSAAETTDPYRSPAAEAPASEAAQRITQDSGGQTPAPAEGPLTQPVDPLSAEPREDVSPDVPPGRRPLPDDLRLSAQSASDTSSPSVQTSGTGTRQSQSTQPANGRSNNSPNKHTLGETPPHAAQSPEISAAILTRPADASVAQSPAQPDPSAAKQGLSAVNQPSHPSTTTGDEGLETAPDSVAHAPDSPSPKPRQGMSKAAETGHGVRGKQVRAGHDAPTPADRSTVAEHAASQGGITEAVPNSKSHPENRVRLGANRDQSKTVPAAAGTEHTAPAGAGLDRAANPALAVGEDHVSDSVAEGQTKRGERQQPLTRNVARSAGKAASAPRPAAGPSAAADAVTRDGEWVGDHASIASPAAEGGDLVPQTEISSAVDRLPPGQVDAGVAADLGTEHGLEPAAPAPAERPGSVNGRSSEASSQAGRTPLEAARFVQRVARAIQVGGQRDGSVQLRLSPPELGRLNLEVQIEDGVVTARIEAETDMARQLLLDHLPLLRQRLAEQDYKIGRFQVDLAGNMADGSRHGTPPDGRDPGRAGAGRSGRRGKSQQSTASAVFRSQGAPIRTDRRLDVRI